MFYICLSIYNEERDLPQLLVTLDDFIKNFGQPVQIVALNDASKDRTLPILEEAARRLPITVITTEYNRGFGYGIATLLEYVMKHGQADDVALFMDADNTHDPGLAPKFMEKIRAGADVVIASRFQPDSVITGFPLRRRMLSRLAAFYFGMVLHLPGVRDYTSGFRTYRVGILQKLGQTCNQHIVLPYSFECQITILHLLSPFARFAEIPFIYRYDAKQGISKLRLWRTVRNTLKIGAMMLVERR